MTRNRTGCWHVVSVGVATLLFLPSCSNTVELSEQALRSIELVRVSEDVPQTAEISGRLSDIQSDTRGAIWFSSLVTAPVGIVMEVIDWSQTRDNTSLRFRDFLDHAEVDVPKLVRNRFLSRLARAGLFRSVHADPGQATFHLSIEHGLSDGLGLRGAWKPWITVVGALESHDGVVLWHYETTVSENDERVPEVRFPTRQEVFLRKAYARAAEIAAKQLVDHLARR